MKTRVKNVLFHIDRKLIKLCGNIYINPNFLTFLRILLVPFIIFFYINEYYIITSVFFILAIITDLIDGLMARKYNKETKLGAFIDPLADKILFISLATLFYDYIWTWLFMSLIFIEISLIFVRIIKIIFYKNNKKSSINIKANIAGKMKSLSEVIGIMILFFYCNNNYLVIIANIILSLALLLSLFSISKQIKKSKN